MRNVDATLVNAEPVASPTPNNSPAMIVDQIIAYAFQGTVTGAVTGTFKLQASCDQGRTPRGDGVVNWIDIAGATATLALATPVMINVQMPGYKWVRAVYTPSSGTGTLTVRMTGKGQAA